MSELRPPIIMIADQSYHNAYDPQPEAFTLENIAIGLGNTCRWGGQLGKVERKEHRGARPMQQRPEPTVLLKSNFYSVAEHSVLGARYHMHRQEKDLAKLFLLHDAGEPVCGGDIATPYKNHLDTVHEWERRAQEVLIDAFDLPKDGFKLIKETDMRICRNEVHTLFDDTQEWVQHLEPLCYETGFDREFIKLEFWSPERAMNEWYDMATKLGLRNKYVT